MNIADQANMKAEIRRILEESSVGLQEQTKSEVVQRLFLMVRDIYFKGVNDASSGAAKIITAARHHH